jgi:hypothetical protein
MFSLLDFFKQVVTHENVNCIPSDLIAPGFPDSFAAHLFKLCKKARYGFMPFALMLCRPEDTEWILSNFISSIDFENTMLPISVALFTNNTEDYQERNFVTLLLWCAYHSYRMLSVFLEYGVRSGAEEAFDHIVRHGDVKSNHILERMLLKGIGVNYKALHYTQTGALIQKYKFRRTCCEGVVVRLLGLLRFKKTKYFSGLDPRLLKQMVVTPVWKTRYLECWDSNKT